MSSARRSGDVDIGVMAYGSTTPEDLNLAGHTLPGLCTPMQFLDNPGPGALPKIARELRN